MPAPKNQAICLKKTGTPLEVQNAPFPTASADEIVVKNAAVAITPLGCHMQHAGVFVHQWATIFGCNVAGEVYEVGSGVSRFKEGYRSVAVEAAVCALSVQEPCPCTPSVLTPALDLPYPTLEDPTPSVAKTLVVYGASSSVGSMSTQIAAATGIIIIVIAGAHNFDLVKRCGAAHVFDHKDSSLVESVVDTVKASGSEFVDKLGGGHLACVHPPPAENVPTNIHAGMIFAVNDVASPVYKDFVTSALQSGKLKCLPPPTIVGKGLEDIKDALTKFKAGVSATKLVVEL